VDEKRAKKEAEAEEATGEIHSLQQAVTLNMLRVFRKR